MLAYPHLADGLNLYRGKLVHPAVAEAQGKDFTAAADALAD
jgi:alanine dehydrogenase